MKKTLTECFAANMVVGEAGYMRETGASRERTEQRPVPNEQAGFQ